VAGRADTRAALSPQDPYLAANRRRFDHADERSAAAAVGIKP